MAQRMSVTAFAIPGYETPDAAPYEPESDPKATPYKVPPVAWMVIFLLVGYFGIRWLLED
jgi:hypothetical protein